jgi:hypothetical protein
MQQPESREQRVNRRGSGQRTAGGEDAGAQLMQAAICPSAPKKLQAQDRRLRRVQRTQRTPALRGQFGRPVANLRCGRQIDLSADQIGRSLSWLRSTAWVRMKKLWNQQGPPQQSPTRAPNPRQRNFITARHSCARILRRVKFAGNLRSAEQRRAVHGGEQRAAGAKSQPLARPSTVTVVCRLFTSTHANN